MRFSLQPDQVQLRDAVAATLAQLCPPAEVRAPAKNAASRWSGYAELGLFGIEAPAEFGGLGLGPVEQVLVLETCGQFALPDPVVNTAMVAVPGLVGCNPERASSMIRGEEPAIPADLDHPEASVRGALGTAAFQLGLATTMLNLAVEYAKIREQFGKPIGSFQAVKHHLANAAISIEFARPLVYRAATSLAAAHIDTSIHVSMAKLRADECALFVAKTSLQVHGAIGYTTEHDLHLWMKRAWACAAAWGTVNDHRAVLRAHLLRTTDLWENHHV